MDFFPSFNEFNKKIKNQQNQIVYTKFSADLDTPVSLILKLAKNEKNSFLLESVTGGEIKGRYSVLGMKPDLIWKCNLKESKINRNVLKKSNNFFKQKESPINALKSLIQECEVKIPDNLPAMSAGLFGYLSYEMMNLVKEVSDDSKKNLGLPQSILFRPSIIIIIDNVKGEIIAINPIWINTINSNKSSVINLYNKSKENLKIFIDKISAPLSAYNFDFNDRKIKRTTSKPISNFSKTDFLKNVKKAINYIRLGDILQVVLSQRWKLEFKNHPFSFYRALRKTNPSPYMFYFNFKDFQIVGASPEILVKVSKNKVTIRPIAGTRPRGRNLKEDRYYEKELLKDPKENAEHLMLLDLGRNDVSKVSDIGTVKTTESFIVEKYSHVMHIVSNVEGELNPKYDNVDALFAGLPAGTVSGAPKIRAMEIINELEHQGRGVYAGGVGYFGGSKEMDLCIALRTAIIKNNNIYIQAGAGIVFGSVPQNEYLETLNKAKALFEAVKIAKQQFND